MFFPGLSDQVYIATGATDMRKSINGLSIMVAEQLALNPLSGYLFCFCNRKRDIVKILYLDRNGFCLWHKRLEKDRFHWPENEADVIAKLKRLLQYIPQNNCEDPPLVDCSDPLDREDEELNKIVPDNPNQPYDIKEVINHVVDAGSFFEVHEEFAQNIVVGFAHLGGRSVGIIANQPEVLAGVLDINS